MLDLFPALLFIQQHKYMLDCRCFTIDHASSRQKFQDLQQGPERKLGKNKSAPLTMKLLDLFGLRSYIFNKFIFRKLPSKYTFVNSTDQGTLGQGGKVFCIGDSRQQPIVEGYELKAELLQQNGLCVPVVFLQLLGDDFSNKPYLVYSHGNSSDLSDAFLFFKKMTRFLKFNIVVYDYSGYGISKAQTTQSSLCQDLQLVLSWLNVRKEQIILWGFSLGSFPTLSVASKYKFGGVILHSPIASGACFFDKQLENQSPQGQFQGYTYDFDCLDNLSSISQVQSEILIMHSSSDEIIPIQHAMKLYSIVKSNNKQGYSFLEVDKIKHNQMHYYLSTPNPNPLNILFKQMMSKMEKKVHRFIVSNIKRTKTSQIRKNRKEKMIKEKEELIRMEADQTDEGDWQITQNEEESIQQQNDILQIGVKNHKNYFGARNSVKPVVPVGDSGRE